MDYSVLLQSVLGVVLKSGERLIAEWQRPDGLRGYGDKADVDIEIEQELRPALLQLLDCDFWGEETGTTLTGNKHCWVVDPNDGTADFLSGLKGSAISVGLLCDGVPVLGVVYAPVTAARGPDCIAWASGMSGIYRNGDYVQSSLGSAELAAGTKVLVSAAARRKPALNAQLCSPAEPVPTTSIAYRLAAVGAGDAVACISLVGVSAHDVVAGHAILTGAGGVLLDEQGREVQYANLAEMKPISARCFGGARSACEALLGRDWHRIFSEDDCGEEAISSRG